MPAPFRLFPAQTSAEKIHRARVERVYRRLEKYRPRYRGWANIVGGWSEGWSFVILNGIVVMTVGVGVLVAALGAGANVEKAMWAAGTVAFLLSIFFILQVGVSGGSVIDRWIARFAATPATESCVRDFIAKLKNHPDPRLTQLWQGWMNRSGAARITAHEIELLESAFDDLRRWNEEEAHRVTGLDLVENAFGMVSQARAVNNERHLTHALVAPNEPPATSRSRL